jgi:hypothetical protein
MGLNQMEDIATVSRFSCETGREISMAVKPGLAEFMENHYEQNLKAANYLFVAHGAGLIGCLSALKDYKTTPELHGIGLFIVFFGVGFLGAIVNYIGLFFARILAINAVFNETEVDPPTSSFITWVHFIGLGITLLALFGGVIGLIVRFASL